MSTSQSRSEATTKEHDATLGVEIPKATKRQWAGLIIMVIPLFMLATDVTVLYLAMPAISADLLPAGSQQLWILHIGEFLSAATMITFGLLARKIGARRLLLGAVATYGAASLIAAYAVNPEMLIGGRALLGIAAAAFTPAGMILVRRAFRNPKQYNVAFAIYMAAFSGGMAAGPPFGGLILEHFWWGAVFLINVPIAAVLLIGGPFLLERNHADRDVRIDTPSVVLSITAIIALVYGLQELSASGVSWLPLLSAAAGIGLLLLFLRRQRKAAHPLLDLSLFGNRTVRLILLILFAMMFAMSLAEMLIPQYLQLVRGLSAFETGLILVGPAIGGTAGTILTPLLAGAKHKGLASAAAIFLTGTLAGVLVLVLAEAHLLSLITALALISLTGAPFITLLSQILISAAPEEKTGSATAVQDVTASLGMASSLALLGAGALVLYRRVLSEWAHSSIPTETVGTAGESFGSATAVTTELNSIQGRLLMEAADSAFTVTTQAGWGFYAVMCALIAVVLIIKRRHIRLG